MNKFIMKMTYSSASWARMLKAPEDRSIVVNALFKHLNGSLESMYWEVETTSTICVANLPDSVSAAAAVTAATKTGAFKDVVVHEVLTFEQLEEVVALARSAENVYHAPGQSTIERDV